jgi:hypothetical protein
MTERVGETPLPNLPEAAYLWQRAFSDLARVQGLSVLDALDLVGFPRAYLLKMGLDGAEMDRVAAQVDAATPEEEGR